MKKLSHITESVWSDIQDRNAREVTRKEDDVNLLDASDFCQYLKKIYEGEIYYTGDDGVYALVFKELEGGYYFYLYSCTEYMCIYSAPDGLMPPKELYDKLNTTYDIWEDRNEESGELELMISPKDSEEDTIPNMFFIEVLEFILNNLPNDFKAEIKKK